jgi:hypothetical protein
VLEYALGDGDVAAYRVSLDAEAVDGPLGTWSFGAGSPDVESVAAGADFDEAVQVFGDHVAGCLGRHAALEAVVEVDAADAFSEYEPEADSGC